VDAGGRESDLRYRWILIFIALGVKMIISIYQYSWFLFAYSINNELGWDLATIGLTFTIFVMAMTFVQPFSGWVADTHGPKGVAISGSLMTATGLILSSSAAEPWQLYLFYGLGGLGAGSLNGISTASAIKWFPDKRGVATGVVEFGFGAGTALFNWIIQALLGAGGFRSTFFYLGLFMLFVLAPLSFLYRYPNEGFIAHLNASTKKLVSISRDFRPPEVLKTYQWYLIYFSFTFTIAVVLMFGAQLKMLAQEYHLPTSYFSFLLVLFPLGNGLSRIVAGAVSDKMGREHTMLVFYSLLGIAILSLVKFGHVPVFFIGMVFIAALLGGSPFVLYPSTVGDYYGVRYSTTNFGILITAKAWAGLISGWFSGFLAAQFGSYAIPLIALSVCCFAAAICSHPRILKPPST
jgi:OFA family oxalate/formate antiporter-like MFS transporter